MMYQGDGDEDTASSSDSDFESTADVSLEFEGTYPYQNLIK